MPLLEHSPVWLGLALGGASVLSIGPNTLMMVREGLVRGRIGTVATLVWSSNLAALAAALALTDAVGTLGSPLRMVLSWLGLAATCWFAYAAMRAAHSGRTAFAGGLQGKETIIRCARRVALVVWLNPLMYIEFVLIPSAVCSHLDGDKPRLQFIAGLVLMAALSCFGYTLGGRACARLLKSRRTLQAFDLLSGVVLTSIAGVMVFRLLIAAK